MAALPPSMPTPMKKFLSKHWTWMSALLLGVAVGLFWRLAHPHMLAYQEQFLLFLFGQDYFCSCLSEPGGLARWLGEFLTQFYNNPTYGALVLALLFCLLALLALWRKQRVLSPLGLIPLVLLWHAMGDESLLLSYVVALLLAMACCRALGKPRMWVGLAVALVGMPLLYWLIGPMVMLVAVYMAVVLPLEARRDSRLAALGVGLAAVVMVVLSVVVSAHVVPYPLIRLATGLWYYRFPLLFPGLLALIPALVVMADVVALLVGEKKRQAPFVLGLLAAVVLLAVFLVPKGFDAKKSELMEYDLLVRTGQWQAIISKAERQQPDLPMSVSATNLALAMENQLGERAFHFFQHGTQGLIPPFERNFATTMLTGEIYYCMGMVNTAQRMAFEAMEAIPNNVKSARALKRLAETNLINGQYDVARKYMLLLQKTLFYSKWASQTMTLLGDEAKINAHPVYGRMRQMRLADNFLFSEQEGDKMCGQLFLHNTQNAVAMQYLLLWPLLQRDIPSFMQYVQVVQQRTSYNPRHVQEAICYAFGQQQQRPPQELVDNMVQQQFLQFAKVFNQGGRQNTTQLQPFRNTVWYYLVNGQ